eukprot:Colp12_sorted_trinity150504_noHs@34582
MAFEKDVKPSLAELQSANLPSSCAELVNSKKRPYDELVDLSLVKKELLQEFSHVDKKLRLAWEELDGPKKAKRKRVSFNDAKLEIVHYIPSLKSLKARAIAMELPEDLKELVGRDYALRDGTRTRIVVVGQGRIFGRLFMTLPQLRDYFATSRLDKDVSIFLKTVQHTYEEEYFETDVYAELFPEDFVAPCQIVLVTADSSAPLVCYYSTFFSSRNKRFLPYLPVIDRQVSVFWPDDGSTYIGCITSYNPTTGLHVVTYAADESLEELNISDLRRKGELKFL